MGLFLTNQPLFTCDFLLVSSPLDRWEDVEPLTYGVYDGLGKWLIIQFISWGVLYFGDMLALLLHDELKLEGNSWNVHVAV